MSWRSLQLSSVGRGNERTLKVEKDCFLSCLLLLDCCFTCFLALLVLIPSLSHRFLWKAGPGRSTLPLLSQTRGRKRGPYNLDEKEGVGAKEWRSGMLSISNPSSPWLWLAGGERWSRLGRIQRHHTAPTTATRRRRRAPPTTNPTSPSLNPFATASTPIKTNSDAPANRGFGRGKR